MDPVHHDATIATPLSRADYERTTDGRPRRCPDEACNGAAIHVDPPAHEESIDDVIERRGRRRYNCASCGLPAPRPRSIQCGRCTAYLDPRDPVCLACEPLAPAPPNPPSGWEMAIRRAPTSQAEHDRAVQWGIEGEAQWDRYSTPQQYPSRLAIRFGWLDHRQEFMPGSDDEKLALDMQWRAARIEELTGCLRLLKSHGDACKAPSKSRRLPDWYSHLAARAWDLYKACIVSWAADLVNAIRKRQVTYVIVVNRAEMDEEVHVRRARTTPFGSLKGAIAAATATYRVSMGDIPRAFDDSATAEFKPGAIAYAASATPYKHTLPGGIQFGMMAVNPSRNGSSSSTTTRSSRTDDAEACLSAARVGGRWTPVLQRDDGTTEQVATVEGGRPFNELEIHLLCLVDLGAIEVVTIDVDEDGNKLPKPLKRFNEVKLTLSDALHRVQRAVHQGHHRHPTARHLQYDDARRMVSAARHAARDAFESWGLIEVVSEELPRASKSTGKAA